MKSTEKLTVGLIRAFPHAECKDNSRFAFSKALASEVNPKKREKNVLN